MSTENNNDAALSQCLGLQPPMQPAQLHQLPTDPTNNSSQLLLPNVYGDLFRPILSADGQLVLDVQCGETHGVLYMSRFCQGSKGPCILYNQQWLTPNEFQYICGRESAKDWKRSIRHRGKSLKLLLTKGVLHVHPTSCTCPGCRISSPVNRSRLSLTTQASAMLANYYSAALFAPHTAALPVTAPPTSVVKLQAPMSFSASSQLSALPSSTNADYSASFFAARPPAQQHDFRSLTISASDPHQSLTCLPSQQNVALPERHSGFQHQQNNLSSNAADFYDANSASFFTAMLQRYAASHFLNHQTINESSYAHFMAPPSTSAPTAQTSSSGFLFPPFNSVTDNPPAVKKQNFFSTSHFVPTRPVVNGQNSVDGLHATPVITPLALKLSETSAFSSIFQRQSLPAMDNSTHSPDSTYGSEYNKPDEQHQLMGSSTTCQQDKSASINSEDKSVTRSNSLHQWTMDEVIGFFVQVGAAQRGIKVDDRVADNRPASAHLDELAAILRVPSSTLSMLLNVAADSMIATPWVTDDNLTDEMKAPTTAANDLARFNVLAEDELHN